MGEHLIRRTRRVDLDVHLQLGAHAASLEVARQNPASRNPLARGVPVLHVRPLHAHRHADVAALHIGRLVDPELKAPIRPELSTPREPLVHIVGPKLQVLRQLRDQLLCQLRERRLVDWDGACGGAVVVVGHDFTRQQVLLSPSYRWLSTPDSQFGNRGFDSPWGHLSSAPAASTSRRTWRPTASAPVPRERWPAAAGGSRGRSWSGRTPAVATWRRDSPARRW